MIQVTFFLSFYWFVFVFFLRWSKVNLFKILVDPAAANGADPEDPYNFEGSTVPEPPPVPLQEVHFSFDYFKLNFLV